MRQSTLWTLGLIGAALLFVHMQQQQPARSRGRMRGRNLGAAIVSSHPTVSAHGMITGPSGAGTAPAGGAGGAGGAGTVPTVLKPMQPSTVVISPRVNINRPGTAASPGSPGNNR